MFGFPLDVAPQQKVSERFFVQDQISTGLVGNKGTVFNRSGDWFSIVAAPASVVRAIEQQLPSGL